MRVLVTGANGFVGTAICTELVQNSVQVIKLNRNNIDKLVDLRSEIIFADITDVDFCSIAKKIGKVDAVIHAAGLAHQFGDTSKEKFWKVNVEGTRNVAKLSKSLEARHFILISSVSVYGETQDAESVEGIKESVVCNPKGFYGESKYEAELVCREVLERSKTDLTILRLATVIGEGDHGNVSKLINLIKSGRFIWIGNGKNKKSLIYKGDVAKAVNCVLQNETSKKNRTSKIETFNLTSKAVSMKEIVSIIAESLNVRVFPIRIPGNFVTISLRIASKLTKATKLIQLEKSVNKWVGEDKYVGEALFEQYSFLPETSIKEALEKEVNYYQKKNK